MTASIELGAVVLNMRILTPIDLKYRDQLFKEMWFHLDNALYLDTCEYDIQMQFRFKLKRVGSIPYFPPALEDSTEEDYCVPYRHYECMNYDRCLITALTQGWITFFCPIHCTNFRSEEKEVELWKAQNVVI